jgi:FkbM family methyltransferase
MIKVGRYNIVYDVDEMSSLDSHIILHGILDDYLLHNVYKYISDGIFLDVGANAGYYSLVFARQGMKCFAFEPIKHIYNKLVKNVELNNLDITCLDVAVQDDPDKEFINIYSIECVDGDNLTNDGLSSLVNIGLYRTGTHLVKATTLDKFCENKNISFIKIDAEGFDYNIIVGGLETIKRCKPKILYEHSEVMDLITKNDCSKNCYDIIKSLGYTQFFTDSLPLKEIKEFEYRQYSNVLCVP